MVRLSGQLAKAVAEGIFTPRTAGRALEHYRFQLGWVKDPETKEIIDEALLLYMRAPHSFTTQDVVEIQAHGGAAGLKKILELCLRRGARLAEPGEFTRRAFEGGRIDLLQAEATLEIIRAKTEAALNSSARQLQGELSLTLRALRSRLLEWLTGVEAELEFPEEGVSYLDREKLSREVEEAAAELRDLSAGAEKGRLVRDGVSLVIAGRPNVGKSSLLNCLLGEDRAIVTAIPGTTRDTVEEWFNLYGILIRLIDTAGLRKAQDEIEQLGVERTRRNLKAAELVYLVLDGSRPLTPQDHAILEEMRGKNGFCLLNKADLELRLDSQELRQYFPPERIFAISAKNGQGVKPLLKATHAFLSAFLQIRPEAAIVLNLRQRESLKQALSGLELAKAHLDEGLSEEFIALDLREAAGCLGELSGESLSEEVLERIFSQFCIGK